MSLFPLAPDAKIRIANGKIGIHSMGEDIISWVNEDIPLQLAETTVDPLEEIWWKRGWHKSLDFLKGASARRTGAPALAYASRQTRSNGSLFYDDSLLEAALLSRRSARCFDVSRPMERATFDMLSVALVSGVPFEGENALSPETFPIHIFAYRIKDMPAGIYSLNPKTKSPAMIRPGDFSREIATATSGFPPSKTAALTVLLSVDMKRLFAEKPEGSNTLRQCYVLVGQMAQRALVRASAAGIQGVCTPAFSESKISRLTLADSLTVVPVYTFSMGYPP